MAMKTGLIQAGHWVAIALILSAALTPATNATAGQAEPPFSSTSDTVFDIIRTGDPSTFRCLSYDGRDTRQMWDKRVDGEDYHDTYLFRAHFTDGPPVDFIVNPEFGSQEAARAEVERYTHALGQLAPLFRQNIRQIGIHKGMPTYSAGTGKIFVYADRTSLRISENHLEESLLHEAVHASLDANHRLAPDWVAVQQQDPGFLTDYAASRPEREDLAETALFAWGLLHHPDRIPPVDSRDIRAQVPARLAYLNQLFARPVQLDPPPVPPERCR